MAKKFSFSFSLTQLSIDRSNIEIINRIGGFILNIKFLLKIHLSICEFSVLAKAAAYRYLKSAKN